MKPSVDNTVLFMGTNSARSSLVTFQRLLASLLFYSVVCCILQGMCNFDSVCRLCGTSEGVKLKIFDPGMDHVSKIHQLLPIMVRGVNLS